MFDNFLFNQDTFYKAFIKDICRAKNTVIIESPFITKKRLSILIPIFRKLIKRNVKIIVNTKPFEEHDPLFYYQAIESIAKLQDIGAEVYMTIGHHRKLAIIDSNILYEGSLNILSQNDSCEIMRRINDITIVDEMVSFIGIRDWVK